MVHPLKVQEDVGALRRLVHEFCVELNASEADCGRAALITTELGTNTLRHARPPGTMIVVPLRPPRARGVEILAVDHGPGIGDLAAALSGERQTFQFGESSLGCGLASVRRLASEFDVFTVPGQGTVVLARISFERGAEPAHFRWGAVSVPVLGESENGDAWMVAMHDSACTALVVDGLGHGPEAARASRAALELFASHPEVDLTRYLGDAHLALRSTRGAALSVCRIVPSERRLIFAGVGNVEGRIYGESSSEGLTPRSGTLGMHLHAPRFHVRETAWEAGAMLVLHSDGVRHSFDLGARRELARHDPSIVAAILHRDFARGRDDATVVVVQHKPSVVQ